VQAESANADKAATLSAKRRDNALMKGLPQNLL